MGDPGYVNTDSYDSPVSFHSWCSFSIDDIIYIFTFQLESYYSDKLISLIWMIPVVIADDQIKSAACSRSWIELLSSWLKWLFGLQWYV